MPRPGFYNDNEYRAYPFIARADYLDQGFPDSAVVDCGIIMGLSSRFLPGTHSVWLAGVSRSSGVLRFTFNSDAPGCIGHPLIFEFDDAAQEWTTSFAESDDSSESYGDCALEPRWEGFLVVGPTSALFDWLAEQGSPAALTAKDRALEPGKIQSLDKSYVRAVNVGNFPRVIYSPPSGCGDPPNVITDIVVNERCLQGDLRFKEGMHCRIRQVERANELIVSAELGAGDTDTSEACAHGGELPLYAGEPADPVTGFYSGGPSCKQVISTINGVGGTNVNIVGGTGVAVTANAETNTLTISLTQNNVLNNCGT